MGSRLPDSGSKGPRIGTVYQGGLESVLALVMTMGLGAWADSKFGTSPILLFVGLGIGFGAFILRLSRLSRQLSGESAGEVRPQSETRDDESDGQDC